MTEATNIAGLTLARKLLNYDRAAFVLCHIVPEAGLSADDQAIADDYTAAIAAITGAAAELQRLSAERDELAAKYDELLVALHSVGSALGIEEADRSPYSIACGVLVMANKLAAIERAEPVAWIEHELQGTGLRHLHFERRPNALRDDVVAPVWTALIARPEPGAAQQPPAADHCEDALEMVQPPAADHCEDALEMVQPPAAETARLSPTEDEIRYTADQDWTGLSGATAWHLAERHGEGWAGIGAMMEAWRDAEVSRVAAALQAEADTLRRERDELAARLAEIEAQEPVAWVPIHPRTGPLWSMTTGSPDEERLPHYPLKPLYTRPAPAATPAAKPCRCGLDGCADRVACPRNGGAA